MSFSVIAGLAAIQVASNQIASMVFMYGAIFAIFYFVLIRPQQKQRKSHDALVRSLKKGDEIVTAGGILGRVTEVSDHFVTVEIADGVRIKIQKFQVTSLMPKGTLKGA